MFVEIPRKHIIISMKFDENCRKVIIFCKNSNKNTNTFEFFFENFEFGALRRCAKLVDIENCIKIDYLVAKLGFDREENEPSEV